MLGVSIVIPAFNRERELPRAVASCLAEDSAAMEVIVVDDGSTDGTAGSLDHVRDTRLRVLRHDENRGANAARNTGIRQAGGEWIIALDSDDELLPGALNQIAEAIHEHGGDVERLAFSFQRDDGRRSPLPEYGDRTLDYRAYVASLEDRELYDFLPCARRSTFESVAWPESRWSDHCLYNLDFARQFRTRFCSTPVAQVHLDAAARTSVMRRRALVAREAAAGLGAEMDLVLERHGSELKRSAPSTFRMFRRMRAAYHFLQGERLRGLRRSIECLREAPFSAEQWVLPMIGMAGPRAFASLRERRPPAT